MDVFTKNELSSLIDQLDSFVENSDGKNNRPKTNDHFDFLVCECFCLGLPEIQSFLLSRHDRQSLIMTLPSWSEEDFKSELSELGLGQGCGKCVRERETWMELFMVSLNK